ncbi:hypothetical protein Poly30_57050 [Planctomycetes bacterium Poly30]|uniref:Uncharacterized protein n=1 Tax=Saltatorellus ferox TaxID=2528018 RepID=A0A518F1C5_9BACT|nr:hypothetical protein Poly30_57050 [Planctomycetes bacterium Poly30]
MAAEAVARVFNEENQGQELNGLWGRERGELKEPPESPLVGEGFSAVRDSLRIGASDAGILVAG